MEEQERRLARFGRLSPFRPGDEPTTTPSTHSLSGADRPHRWERSPHSRPWMPDGRIQLRIVVQRIARASITALSLTRQNWAGRRFALQGRTQNAGHRNGSSLVPKSDDPTQRRSLAAVASSGRSRRGAPSASTETSGAPTVPRQRPQGSRGDRGFLGSAAARQAERGCHFAPSTQDLVTRTPASAGDRLVTKQPDRLDRRAATGGSVTAAGTLLQDGALRADQQRSNLLHTEWVLAQRARGEFASDGGDSIAMDRLRRRRSLVGKQARGALGGR